MKKGLFITIEGPDGSGKTTVASEVVKELINIGYDVVHTREPGGIDIAEQIRDVILNPHNTAMDARTEALLYAASRRQHLVEKVIPAIKEGKIVICERFLDSSLAYQGYGRGLGVEPILSINEFAIDGNMPDLTIYLDIDEKIGLERLKDRENKDRLDVESQSFHHLVNQGYKETVEKFKDRIRIVDASKPLDEVISNTMRIIIEYIHG